MVAGRSLDPVAGHPRECRNGIEPIMKISASWRSLGLIAFLAPLSFVAGAATPMASSAPQWSQPAPLLAGLTADNSPYFNRFAPTFDGTGAAYVYEMIVQNGQRELVWSHSSGPDMPWTAPAVALSEADPYAPDTGVVDAALLSDHLGHLIFILSTLDPDGPTQLRAWRFDAVNGWSGPVEIASGLTSSCYFSAAADNKGNVVLSCRGANAPAFVYSAAQDAWRSASPILTSTGFYLLKSFQLVSNASGSGIYAVYGEGVNVGYGPLYVRRFDSTKLDWQAKRRVLAANGDSNTVSAAVDDTGALSLLYFGNAYERTVKASRYKNGFWSLPVTVLDVTGSPNNVYLGSASANAAGEILAPMMAVNSSVTAQVYAAHWNGSQWNAEVVSSAISPGYYAYNFRASAAWAGSGSAAVILFSYGGGSVPAYNGLLSAYSDGSNGWSPTVAVPGVTYTLSTFGVFASPSGEPLEINYDPYDKTPVDEYAMGSAWLQN